jgi:hypothetical protein
MRGGALLNFLVFAGDFGINGFSAWCFCGHDVVDWMANVESKPAFLPIRKFCKFIKFIFWCWGDGHSLEVSRCSER